VLQLFILLYYQPSSSHPSIKTKP